MWMDSEVHLFFYLTLKMFFFFFKIILFLGQQSKSSTEPIKKTAVKNKRDGKKRRNWDDALFPNINNSIFFSSSPLSYFMNYH